MFRRQAAVCSLGFYRLCSFKRTGKGRTSCTGSNAHPLFPHPLMCYRPRSVFRFSPLFASCPRAQLLLHRFDHTSPLFLFTRLSIALPVVACLEAACGRTLYIPVVVVRGPLRSTYHSSDPATDRSRHFETTAGIERKGPTLGNKGDKSDTATTRQKDRGDSK